MSARMDAPIICDCGELEPRQVIELMVRGLMQEQVDHPTKLNKNQIQTSYRLVFHDQLAKLDSLRVIQHAKETQ